MLDRARPAWFAARGVKLIGLDVPSVDELTNKDMAIHHLLDAANLLILSVSTSGPSRPASIN